MKISIKTTKYFGMLMLLMVIPFLFSGINQLSKDINNQESNQTSEESTNNTDEIGILWDHNPSAEYFEFSFDNELNYKILTIDRFDEIYQKIYFGIQSRDNKSKTWTPNSAIIENILEPDMGRGHHGNAIDHFGIENIPEEWFNIENIDFFIGYKDSLSDWPADNSWKENIFISEGETVKKVSVDNLIANPGSVYNFNPIQDSANNNSVEVEFNFTDADYRSSNLLYKINDGEWTELTNIEEGKNEFLIQNINPYEENTISFGMDRTYDDFTFFQELEEYEFNADEINTVIENLTAKEITQNTANIEFDVTIGNTNNVFEIRNRVVEDLEYWTDFSPQEGKNVIELTGLTEGTDYIFEIKRDGNIEYSIIFSTEKIKSVISDVNIKDSGQTSAKAVFNVALGNPGLNEKFYYRTSYWKDDSNKYEDDEWIEFSAVDGKNVIELTDLIIGANYTFEVKIEGTEPISVGFKVTKNNTQFIIFSIITGSFIFLTILGFTIHRLRS